MVATSGMTLEEALSSGQGAERPFRCEAHHDTQASASVNVVKGLWFCHACHASGSVEQGKKAPRLDALQAMLNPEKAARIYPQAYLELFNPPTYWLTRFPDWLCHAMGFGQDPFTGDATFPVHTPSGLLAGVGRRRNEQEKGTRYLYPKGWSASQSLFGTAGRYPPLPVLTLVEGAADAAACWQVGAPAVAVYGAGLHKPQKELIVRYNPKAILLGFDTDDAGEKAVSAAFKQLSRIAPLARVYWSEKDPGDTPIGARRSALAKAVRRTNYGADVIPIWEDNITSMVTAYHRFVEGAQ